MAESESKVIHELTVVTSRCSNEDSKVLSKPCNIMEDTNLNTAETTFENTTNKPNASASSDLIKKEKTHKYFLEQTSKENKIQLLQPSNKGKDVKIEEQDVAKSTFLEEGFLDALTDEKTIASENTILSLKPENFLHQGIVCVHTSEDREMCLITGMTILADQNNKSGLLILTDQNNKCVKMVDMNTHSVMSQLQLNAAPWDVTTVSEDMLAVTIPAAKMIQLVAVSSNHLSKQDKIRVSEQCFGIHCHQRKLIVAFQSPAMVQVIHLRGNIQSANLNDEYSFMMPEYVIANSSYIYVSDRAVKAVIKLDWDCYEIDTYNSELGTHEGLVILGDGSVFLSDHTKCEIRNISGD